MCCVVYDFPRARISFINAHALKQSGRYKNERPRYVSTGEEVELQLARCDVQPSAVFLHPTAPSLTVDVRGSCRKTRTAVVFCWEVIIRARPCLTWCWSLRVSFRLFCLFWSAAALQVACVYSSECKPAFLSQHAAVRAVELSKLFVISLVSVVIANSTQSCTVSCEMASNIQDYGFGKNIMSNTPVKRIKINLCI